ncbi:MAG: amino acid adenylation domain-containing protein [Syntrophomonas sp.]
MENKEVTEVFIFPLSLAQQRLWFMDQLEPGNPMYNIPEAFRMSGSLNAEALRRTFEAIVSRHESLRTTFRMVDEQPMQCIAEKGSISLCVTDLTDIPEADRGKEGERLKGEEFGKPFDLVHGPLFRVNLLRLGEEEHILLLTMHHIISDGWSIGVLMQEMAALYNAFSQGTTPSLPELPIQYADFAEWQREWLKGDVLESQTSYWKQQLGGTLPILELPTDHPRPAIQTYRGKRKSFVLPKIMEEALKALSQREGGTLFMTALAAFQTLLHRYTGQDDVIVGSVTANRNRVEIEGLIGFFVNTLALRTDLSGNPTFRELLKKVREVALGAYAHPDLPFDMLIEELNLPRDPSYNPLFQVMFLFQNAPMEAFRLSGLTLTSLEAETDTAKFDLTLELIEGLEGLSCSIGYNSDLFNSDTIERMAGHFRTLLQGIVANPDARLSELPLLTEPERHQLLVEWNDTHADYPRDKCIHELFEEQVERTPDAMALNYEDQGLTYRELNRRANRLAHYLRKLGVGPEVLVGICMERSLEMMVGLLGILKAGGAYVPMDPDFPPERLAFLAEDAGAPVVLTQKKLADVLPGIAARKIYLDAPEYHQSAMEMPDTNPEKEVSAENLVYVIYTSGSTGRPKGVSVEHRQLVNYVQGIRERLAFEPGWSYATVSTIAADLGNTVVFPSWCTGGCLHVISKDRLADPVELADYFERYRIDCLKIVPSHLAALLTGPDPQNLMPHRRLILGGEASRCDWIENLQKYATDCRIFNHYGPTETTVGVLTYPVGGVLPALVSGTLPLGRPLPNSKIYILDAQQQPVPVGVPGQLYVSGDGVTRGYWNRPEKTAERFMVNWFSDYPGDRMYRTGDRARYLPDGNIEFLERVDQQVKIRGFRIELGEIESILSEHEAVREVKVIAREDVPGDKRLVAYIVPNGKSIPSLDALREYLKGKLPEYMIPGAFMMLEKIPLTPNGKVDHRALPLPEYTRPELEEAYAAPRTPVEQALAEIWAEVLGVKQVGINDNFFQLGGHSLLAVRLFVRIRKWAGVDLPLAILFRSPTVRSLAEILDPRGSIALVSGGTLPEISVPIQQWRSLVPIHPEGRRSPVFLIHAVGGNLLYYQSLLSYLGPDQPVYGLQARGIDGLLSPHSSMKEMAGYYIAEIRTVQPSGPYFLGGASFGGTCAFEIAQQLAQQGEKVAFLALLDSIGPGASGYRAWRTSLKRRIFRATDDDATQQTFLPIYFLKRLYVYLSNRMRTLYCDFFRLTKRPIPLELRDWDLYRKHNKAINSYVPQQYPGPVTLFRGPEGNDWPYNDPELGWKDLVKGGLRIIIVPARHHEFVESAELGAQFAENLQKAQDDIKKQEPF